MPIKTGEYPNCCSSKVLYAFGGSNTAMYGRETPQDEAQMADDVKRQMEASQQLGYGILSAMLTTEQKLAAKVLEGLGWTMAIESAKKKHSETNLQLWCWAAKDVDKADVVVTNPFAKPKPAVVEMPEGSPVNAAGERMLASYLRVPTDRWIPVDPAAPMVERIRGRRVSIRTRYETDERWQQRNIDARHANSRIAEQWAWGGNSTMPHQITHVYIHPL